MKTPTCKHCNKEGHYETFCPNKPRKPIKSKVEVMNWKTYQEKKAKAPQPKKTPTPLEKKSIQELVKLADLVFAKWIKKRDALTDGTFKCISCNQFHSLKSADAGHFYSRRFNAVRFHEDNVHLECQTDNRLNDNHLIGYRANLEAKIGSERLKWLDEHYRDGHKWNREELLEIIKRYKV